VVKTGCLIKKEDLGWNGMLLCVQDPFQLTHNTAEKVDKKMFDVFRSEIERGFSFCLNGRMEEILDKDSQEGRTELPV